MPPKDVNGQDVNFMVLGVHDTPDLGQVARVRLWVNGEMVDEDMPLPSVITVEEQVTKACQTRISEIKLNVPPERSDVVFKVQKERIVQPDKFRAKP